MDAVLSLIGGLLKVLWKITKFLCKPAWEGLKDLWKILWELYKEKKSQKAACVDKGQGTSRTCDFVGPDKSVQFNAQDLKDKYENCSDEDLHRMCDLMTDNAVKVDENPKLEKVLETYGPDQEILKQEIDSELKRRRMESKKQGKQDTTDDKG